jgi:hypothetical protein
MIPDVKRRAVHGAYYLAGYTVECALKACIAKATKRFDFPPRSVQDIYTHDLTKLVRQAGLEADLQREIGSDPEFGRRWAVVRLWTEESRYQRKSGQEARELYEAITDQQHGVLRWLKERW